MLDFGYYNMDCMSGMKEFPDIQIYVEWNVSRQIHFRRNCSARK